MSIAIAKTYISPPPVPAWEGGIFSVANVIPSDGTDLLGAEYLTDACTEGGVWEDLCSNVNLTPCPPDLPPVGVPLKTFGEPDLVEGAPFGVYDGLECPAVGMSQENILTRAEQRLEYSKSRTVDLQMGEWLEGAADPLTPAATDLRGVIMAFETIAALNYGGVATIIMSRAMAVCARSKHLIEHAFGGELQTVNGTRVAAVAALEDDVENLYLTGQITLLEGPVRTYIAQEVVRPDGTCDPRRALAERLYVPLVECMIIGASAPCDATTP